MKQNYNRMKQRGIVAKTVLLAVLLFCTFTVWAGRINYDSPYTYEKDGILYGYDFDEDGLVKEAWVLGLTDEYDLAAKNGVLDIPATCNIGVKVTAIAKDAFRDRKELRMVKLPLTMMEISAKAFIGCDNLDSIEIDPMNSYLYLEDGIIYDKNVFMYGKRSKLLSAPLYKNEELIITNGIELIGDDAFAGNQFLKKIEISISQNLYNKAKLQIGKSAFEGCPALSSLSLAADSIAIADSAFMNCKALADISFKAKKKSGYYETTNYYEKNIPNPSEIGKSAFVGCQSLKNIDINGSITIGEECFAGCLGFDKVTINGDVIKLQSMAFKDCANLAELNFNIIDGAQQDYKLILGNQVFWGVKHLDRLYIPFPFTCGYSNFAGMTVDDVQLSPQSVLAFLEDDYLIIKRVTENLNYNLKPIYDYRKAIVANFKPRKEVVIPLDIWGIDNGMWLNSPDLKAIYLNPDVIVTPQKKLPEMTMAPESVLESCTLYTRTTIEKLYPFGRPFNTYNYNYLQSCDAVKRCYGEPNPWEKFKHNEQLTPDMDQYDGISEIEAENATVITNDGTITVECAEGKQVRIYSADGRLLYNGPAGQTGIAGRGIYIVTIGASSVKVAL